MKKYNKLELTLAILWVGYWFFNAVSMVGGTTNGPYEVYWWDAIWIPLVIAVFPMALGASIFYRRGE